MISMALTYEPIATYTVASSTSSITFSSIPQTYTDLVLVTNEKQTASSARSSAMQFNSDSNSNYTTTAIRGDGTTPYSYRISSTGKIYYGYWAYSTNAGFDLVTITHINNYTSTSVCKTTITRGSSVVANTEMVVGVWNSTAAINSIYLFMDNLSNFDVGSTFTLYGIKAA